MLRLQSAMEYLTTYGWALLIMAIVLAAMFALGVFNPGQFAGQECLVPAGFSCLSYFIANNGLLTLNLQQSTTSPLNVTGYNCSTNSTTVKIIPIAPSSQVYMAIGANYTFGIKCYTSTGLADNSLISGTLFTGSIGINYTEAQTGFPHTVYGRIAVKVT